MSTETEQKAQDQGDGQAKAITAQSTRNWDGMTDQQLAEFVNSKINSKNPSKKDAALLREFLEASPATASQVGNMATQARHRMITMMAANDVVAECIRREVDQMHERLGWNEASAVDRLLIQQIGICWLHLYGTQQLYSAAHSGSVTLAHADWQERRLTAAQNRFLKATETLARVRKLARGTALQVNIGGQQINVAGSSQP